MARFFIDRPIFAWVIALVIMLAGAMAIIGLPVAQYPTIAPPAVGISASYPGASAKTVEDSVTQIIEQNMTGLDHLLYMSSQSDSSGRVSVTLTFQPGTDPDIAQVQVQNKLQQAMSLLPQEVQQQGIRVQKTSSSFLMVAAFISKDGAMTNDDLADYVVANIKEPLSRLDGVGDITLFGSQYSMRVWLDPNKLNRVQMTPGDVQAAIKAQNAQVAFGKLGGTPSVEDQQFTATIMGQTRLSTVEEFNDILLRVNQDGSKVRLKDVARVELAGESYDAEALYNNDGFWAKEEKAVATRNLSGKKINFLKDLMPNLIGGSADLAPSNKTHMEGEGDFSKVNYAGRNLHFGVRELAMAAIANGTTDEMAGDLSIMGLAGISVEDGEITFEPGERPNKSNREKYTCPLCQANIWGKPGLNVLCGDCDTAFEAAN